MKKYIRSILDTLRLRPIHYPRVDWARDRPRLSPAKQWDGLAQNLAAAVRTGAPLICDGPDGRRSRIVLDVMYESARQDGAWVDVPDLVNC